GREFPGLGELLALDQQRDAPFRDIETLKRGKMFRHAAQELGDAGDLLDLRFDLLRFVGEGPRWREECDGNEGGAEHDRSSEDEDDCMPGAQSTPAGGPPPAVLRSRWDVTCSRYRSPRPGSRPSTWRRSRASRWRRSPRPQSFR